jgi:hypothetical protein
MAQAINRGDFYFLFNYHQREFDLVLASPIPSQMPFMTMYLLTGITVQQVWLYPPTNADIARPDYYSICKSVLGTPGYQSTVYSFADGHLCSLPLLLLLYLLGAISTPPVGVHFEDILVHLHCLLILLVHLFHCIVLTSFNCCPSY